MTAAAPFATATTIEEALAALAAGARPVAGGTDLVVGARQGKAPLPDALVAIHRVAELRGIDWDADALRLGALVTHAEITAHPDVRARFTALADASAIVGSHATRAHGTIGGNLMNASPAMETGGPLMCLGATATLRSTAGARAVAVDELLTGPGATIASGDELLVAVDVPAPRAGNRELRTSGSSTAARWRSRSSARQPSSRSPTARYRRARLAITALAPTIRRVPAAEAALVGHRARPGVRRSGGPCRGGGVRADLRRARIRALSPRDGGGDRQARDRDRPRARSRRRRPDPCERGRPVKIAATLTVNGVRYPVELEPGDEPPRRRPRRRRAHRREGGLRRLGVRRVHDAARRTSR